MKVKQKKSALLPGLITVLMVVAAVAGGLRMTDPDGGRLDTMRQELETITAENEGLTAQVEALRTETAEQKALPEAIQKQKDEGFRLLGELERQIRAGESDKRIAYLTFDDGPYDNTTDAILDILKEKGVHATFFLRHRPDHVAQIQREIREGHTLANHSYSHKIKAVYQSADSCIKEIRDQQKWLTETVGVTPEIYRFPGGSPTAGNKKQAIAAALAHIDVEDLVLDDAAQTVYFTDPEMALDVGAVGKGYAVEQTARAAQARGLTSALLNIGGNVRAIGTKPGGKPWTAGVENPWGDDPAYIQAVELADGDSLVISGDYQRYFEYDGVRYAHLIDLTTGYPARYVSSVAVLARADTGGLADALSTGLFCLPEETGQALAAQNHYAVLWMHPDETTSRSADWPQ